MAKAFIDREHEPTSDAYGVSRLTDVRQLPGLLGL
jgi:2-haloacid dehalogenase